MFNFLCAVVIGLCPIVLVLTFGYLVFTDLASSNDTLIFIFGGLALGAFWLGLLLFKSVRNQGFLKFITSLYATPELDRKKE